MEPIDGYSTSIKHLLPFLQKGEYNYPLILFNLDDDILFFSIIIKVDWTELKSQNSSSSSKSSDSVISSVECTNCSASTDSIVTTTNEFSLYLFFSGFLLINMIWRHSSRAIKNYRKKLLS